MPVAESVYGTTVIRKAVPEPEIVEITAVGDPGPVYLEVWSGWKVECWSYWEWIDVAIDQRRRAAHPRNEPLH